MRRPRRVLEFTYLGSVKKQTLQHGYTLIEILITVSIVVLMLVFLASAASTLKLARLQQHKDLVLRVVNHKIETVRAGGYDNAATSAFTDTQLNILHSVSASTTVSDFNASIKQVTVGVSWVDVGSTTYYLGATTLIVNSGGL